MKYGLCYATFCKIDGLNISFTTLVQKREWDEKEFLEATERYSDLYRCTVDHMTGMHTDEYMEEEGTDLEKWVKGHFTPEYVRKDGCDMVREFLQRQSGADQEHPVYGSMTFFMDIDELEAFGDYVLVSDLL